MAMSLSETAAREAAQAYRELLDALARRYALQQDEARVVLGDTLRGLHALLATMERGGAEADACREPLRTLVCKLSSAATFSAMAQRLLNQYEDASVREEAQRLRAVVEFCLCASCYS